MSHTHPPTVSTVHPLCHSLTQPLPLPLFCFSLHFLLAPPTHSPVLHQLIKAQPPPLSCCWIVSLGFLLWFCCSAFTHPWQRQSLGRFCFLVRLRSRACISCFIHAQPSVAPLQQTTYDQPYSLNLYSLTWLFWYSSTEKTPVKV